MSILPPQTPSMDLSVIIPAYKSREILSVQLPVLLRWTLMWKFQTEVIVVVDGGDVEDYKEIVQSSAVTVTGYAENRGKGYAIMHGFKHAKAPFIIYTDADIPFDEQSMLQMADTLRSHSNKNVWVIGDRTLPGSVYFDNIPMLRKVGSDLFLVIIKHTLGSHFADTQCGLKGFTRKAGEMVFARSKVHRFAFDFECLYIARHLELEVLKMPVLLRNQSPSTVSVFKDGFKLLKDVLKVIMIHKYD